MSDESKNDKAMPQKLTADNFTMDDRDIRLLIEKGLITEAQLQAILAMERASYLAALKGLC